MDAKQLRALQTPLKKRYKKFPEKAGKNDGAYRTLMRNLSDPGQTTNTGKGIGSLAIDLVIVDEPEFKLPGIKGLNERTRQS